MTKKEINYIMDECLDYYRIASSKKENDFYKIIITAKGNTLKKITEKFLEEQPKKQEYEKYMLIVKYYQQLNP